jgi:hypothetical protein
MTTKKEQLVHTTNSSNRQAFPTIQLQANAHFAALATPLMPFQWKLN